MSVSKDGKMPFSPGLNYESEPELKIKGPRNVFFPLNPLHQNPNAKYMIGYHQFQSQNAPILKFFSYYDNRGDHPRDHMKFRNCHILYFVDDGTIKVYEPNQRNSGFRQGCLISRNKIPKTDGGYYNLDDLNLGKTVIFWEKTFKILDCDEFTRNYLKEMGYRVGSPEPAVVDPVYADRQEMDMNLSMIETKRHIDNRAIDFFKLHPKCLHFYAIYNYRPRHFEEHSYVSLYINIVDNTIKIVDEKKLLEYKKQLMNGKYDSYLILKPTLVPKKFRTPPTIGHFRSPVILNLSASSRNMRVTELMSCRAGGRNNLIEFMRDSNPGDKLEKSKKYYTAEDFDLGITLDVFGTKVFIYDCDEFTKEFYRNEFNRELVPVALPKLKESKYHQLVYKGHFGNPEDSLQTCQQLPAVNASKKFLETYILSQRPCRKGSRSDSLLQFYLKCRNGFDSNVLKFISKIVTNDVYVKEQYFVIEWFLEDSSVQIYGLDLNFTASGSSTGKFLKRMKLAKPRSKDSNSATNYYTPSDMFVGNIIYAMNKPFLMLEADEYTYDYMERRCDIFTNSNIKEVLKIVFPPIRIHTDEISNSFEKIDLDKSGFLTYHDFRRVLLNFVPENIKNDLTEHKIKTLARYFAFEEYIGLKYEQLVSKMQYELKNKRFEDFDKLETLFRIFQMDKGESNDHFEPDCTYKILRSYPLPVDRDTLKSFVFKFPKCKGLISYKELVNALNYFANPIKPPEHTPYALNINWKRVEMVRNTNKISYRLFLRDLTKENCSNCI